MPEDVTKEIAATSEPPGGRRTRMRLVSEEFFFLLQRIDRLDEKLSGEIKAQGERIDRLDEKLSGEIKSLDEKIKSLDDKLSNKLNSLGFWAIGIIITLIVGFAGVIVTLAIR